MGRQAWAMKRDRWLMTGIILQVIIDKKRKKCRITIEMADGSPLKTFSSHLQFIA
jgi:hypothetical protein